MNDALPAPGVGAVKQCRRCGETQPVSGFPRNRHGNARPCCHKCTHIERGERRAARPAWRNAHFDRLESEREARRVRKEYRQASRVTGDQKQCPGCLQSLPVDSFPVYKGGKRQYRCKPCAAADARARYHRKHGRSGSGTARGSIDPVKRREAAERIDYLASLLKGLDLNQRLTSAEEWNVAASQLEKLWHLSGDKECVSCREAVPSTAMRPPSPGNSHIGMCNACAQIAWETAYRADVGPLVGPLPGPPKILMKDGTSITVATFARRVREREPIYERSKRFSK